MSSKVSRILNIALYVMMVISAVLIAMLIKNVDTPDMDVLIDTNLRWAKLLFVIGTGVAVVFALLQTFISGGNAKKSIISLVAFAAVFGIAYTAASSEIPVFFGSDVMVQKGILTEWWAKMTDTLLFVTYALFFIAVGSIVYSSLSRLWK